MIRDDVTTTEADAAAFERHYGPEYDDDRPTLADVAEPEPDICPECAAGKCGNCDGRTWYRDADSYADCPCAGAGHS